MEVTDSVLYLRQIGVSAADLNRKESNNGIDSIGLDQTSE